MWDITIKKTCTFIFTNLKKSFSISAFLCFGVVAEDECGPKLTEKSVSRQGWAPCVHSLPWNWKVRCKFLFKRGGDVDHQVVFFFEMKRKVDDTTSALKKQPPFLISFLGYYHKHFFKIYINNLLRVFFFYASKLIPYLYSTTHRWWKLLCPNTRRIGFNVGFICSTSVCIGFPLGIYVCIGLLPATSRFNIILCMPLWSVHSPRPVSIHLHFYYKIFNSPPVGKIIGVNIAGIILGMEIVTKDRC